MSVWLWLVLGAATFGLLLLGGLIWLARGHHLPTWRGARLARLGKMSAKMSASWIGVKVRRTFASGEARVRIDESARAANAKRVAETMGNMKGAFMKLGQMVSFVSDDVPAEYRDVLKNLQTSAPPMAFPALRDVAEQELGMPLERAFADFDTTPLASASIGQVHRAVLPTGEAVAVKIQYPGVADAIRADLDNMTVLYRMVALLYPKLDPKPIVDELRERLGEELDYTLEARNQDGFSQLYDGHPFIRIPKVFASHCRSRVLTTELIEGRRFDDIAAGSADERNHYGEILFRFVFGSTMRYRVFNGDPHPGNYLFDPEGRMVFLDFGCTKFFAEPMMMKWRGLMKAHLSGDKDGFRQRLIDLEFIRDDIKLPTEGLFEYFGYFYEGFREDRVFTYTREYNAKSFRMVFRPEGEFAGYTKQMNMPRDFTFVNRIQWGVVSLLGTLEATNNWHRIKREFVFADKPATPMGEAIHAWRRAWTKEKGLIDKDFYLAQSGLVVTELPGKEICYSI